MTENFALTFFIPSSNHCIVSLFLSVHAIQARVLELKKIIFCDHFNLVNFNYKLPQIFNTPNDEHDQPCSRLFVIVYEISLFIYLNLGLELVWTSKMTNQGPRLTYNQTDLQNTWASLIKLIFGHVKNLGYTTLHLGAILRKGYIFHH